MSNKQKMTVEVLSVDEGLSMIRNQASISGPGIVLNEAGKMALDLAVSTDGIEIEDVALNKGNNDVVNTANNFQVKNKKDASFSNKLEQTDVKQKLSGKKLFQNKGSIPKLK